MDINDSTPHRERILQLEIDSLLHDEFLHRERIVDLEAECARHAIVITHSTPS